MRRPRPPSECRVWVGSCRWRDGHQGPLPFRFVRHLPGWGTKTASVPEWRAGVEQASREETAAQVAGCRRTLWRLEARGGSVAVLAESARAPDAGVSSEGGAERRERPGLPDPASTRRRLIGTRLQRRLTKSRRECTVWAVDSVHGVDRCGGARIDSPRVKICTTIIAWPQCGQTKVGRPSSNASTSR